MNRPIWQYAFACVCVLPAGFALGQADEAAPTRDVARARGQGTSTNPRMQLRLIERFESELKRSLSLDEAQKQEINEVFQDHLTSMREQLAGSDSHDDESERLRELVEQLREAQEEGDREASNAVREEMRKLRMMKGEGETLDFQPLLDEIREYLTEEQLEKYDSLSSRLEMRLRGGKRASADGITLYRQALRGLRLTTEQRQVTREIVAEAVRDWRKADAEDREAIEEEVGELIVEELDEEQAAQFGANLERLKRSQKGAKRPRLAERAQQRAEKSHDDEETADHAHDEDEEHVEEDGNDEE